MKGSDSIQPAPSEARPPSKCLGPLTLMEAAGSLGDLGTFLPLWLGMVAVCGLDARASLIVAGAASVVAGLKFGIPMPIQPMKAIAAVAIACGFSQGDIAAAGFCVGLAVLVLALVRGFDRLHDWIPVPIVRGVQWAVALQLAMAGASMLFTAPGQLRPWTGIEGLWWAPVGLAVLVLLRQNRFIPGAVVVLVIGLVGAAMGPSHEPTFAASSGGDWALIVPALSEWRRGLVQGAIPQLPVTALNSVVAVCALASSLFPQNARRPTPRSIGISIGLMNLIAAPLGGMSMCHGCGGLAAQYGFGARSGTSVVLLGGVMLTVGLFFAAPAAGLLAGFPSALLGAWIIAAGIELVRHTAKGWTRDWVVSLLVPGAVAASVPLVWAAGATWLIYGIFCGLRRRGLCLLSGA